MHYGYTLASDVRYTNNAVASTLTVLPKSLPNPSGLDSEPVISAIGIELYSSTFSLMLSE